VLVVRQTKEPSLGQGAAPTWADQGRWLADPGNWVRSWYPVPGWRVVFPKTFPAACFAVGSVLGWRVVFPKTSAGKFLLFLSYLHVFPGRRESDGRKKGILTEPLASEIPSAKTLGKLGVEPSTEPEVKTAAHFPAPGNVTSVPAIPCRLK